MTENSDIVPGHGPDGAPAAFVGDTAYLSLTELLQAEPGLLDPGAASELALQVTHFARDGDYSLIADPGAFETQYRERLNSEDPDQPWQQNVMRLRDFGVPDFSAIQAPAHQDGNLVFFAADALTGLPYRVTAGLGDLTAPAYAPLPLTPVESPPRPAGQSRRPADRPEPAPETANLADKAASSKAPDFADLPDDLPEPDDI
ncbi:hypothetical protein ACFMPD_12220 [Sedimentitalea sp. HM32M-2]|uniref:hypothetical protein n=1 Tax=Sedimentitalea sp. HM32M-2 TaxID=3351566 RepID=UPI003630E31E